jgi:hypothetical protein
MCALFFVFGVGTSNAATFSIIDESYFGTPVVVGLDPVVPGGPTIIGFDLFPDGSAIDTVTPVPGSSTLFMSSPLTTAFQSVGVFFGADDVAVSQPSAPAAIGVQSPPNTLASEPMSPANATTDISFQVPTPAAGMWIADGPTNDVTVSFYDPSDQLITALAAPPDQIYLFLGIESPTGIGRISLSTSGIDDYYVEDLHFIASIPEPTSVFLVMSCLIVMGTGATYRGNRSCGSQPAMV